MSSVSEVLLSPGVDEDASSQNRRNTTGGKNHRLSWVPVQLKLVSKPPPPLPRSEQKRLRRKVEAREKAKQIQRRTRLETRLRRVQNSLKGRNVTSAHKSSPERLADVKVSASSQSRYINIHTPQANLSCPDCGEEVGTTLRQIEMHRQTSCPAKIIKCPHCAKGCSARFPQERLQYHLRRDCRVVQRIEKMAGEAKKKKTLPIMCPRGCGSAILRDDLARHLQQNCSLRIVSCPQQGCNFCIEALNLEKHVSVCRVKRQRSKMAMASRDRRCKPVPCSPYHKMGCGALVLPKDLARHERDECPHRLVQCRNIGCIEMIRLNIREFHETRMCTVLAKREQVLQQGKQELLCPFNCGASIPLREMSKHKNDECPYRQVKCPVPGCGMEMYHYLLAGHKLVWERRVEQASQRFYFVNPATQETSWTDLGCHLLRRRAAMIQSYNAKPHMTKCKFGCRAEIRNTINAQRNHNEICPNFAVSCPSAGNKCGRRMMRRSVIEHLKRECPVGTRNELLALRGKLQRELVTCSQCGVELLKREEWRHKEEECPKRGMPCKYYDCDLIVPADKWMEHVTQECKHSMKWSAAVARSRARPSRKPPLPRIFSESRS